MDLELLKSFKQGDQVDAGVLFPTLDENESIRWTAASVIDGKREVDGNKTTFRYVEFELDYRGVSLGAVRAIEGESGAVKWESVR